MDHTKTLSSSVAAVVIAALLTMSTSALGACKTTLRGELVPDAPIPSLAFEGKFLFFSLVDKTPANPTGSEKDFQSFVVPNTRTTYPIPFALDIDSPKDCPSELELRVFVYATNPPPKFTYSGPLGGKKTIRLDRFESISLWGGSF